jgi:Methyltransferase domain
MAFIDADMSALFASIPYAKGHGASARIDGGIIYYALACVVRAEVCVCLGSGGGFVPCLMRQAQRDLRLEVGETYLVDAILPEAGFGSPEIEGGWRRVNSVFRRIYPEITVLSCRTSEAANGFFQRNGIHIDFLHIDADHSFEGALSDFAQYAPMVKKTGLVSFHDTNTPALQRVLKSVSERWPEFQCLDLPDFGRGLALLRRELPYRD